MDEHNYKINEKQIASTQPFLAGKVSPNYKKE
jgi:hypothetical protein